MHNQRYLSPRRLAAYLLCLHGQEVSARPQEPAASPTVTVAPVTSTATVDGKPVTATYTPTSFSISGLVPPITAATTVTKTETDGATVAIAIAAGAGIVAGGALAAWLFKPVPGAPPAPTKPPQYSTSSQDEEPPKTTKEPDPTTSEPASCPFPTGGAVQFDKPAQQPMWTAVIPSQSSTGFSPKCTSTGDNHQLLRAADPAYIKELSAVFCKNDLSKDITKTLGKDDLPDDSSWKRADGPAEMVKFTFDFKSQDDACAKHCNDAYASLISRCQYNSHYLYGEGSLEQGCGTYQLEVGGEPRTKLTCTGNKDDPLKNYLYRDAALDAIKNFCKAQDGKVVKQKDASTFIKEDAFTVSYADPCGGSGTYTIKQDLCQKYLMRTLDECDTDTVAYKHGGGLEDTDNCGLFEFHPTGYDKVACYPDNANLNYITAGDHATVTKAMAQDAINEFCGRSGDGQEYTLDPAVKPSSSFIQDTCKEKGMASCGYFYRNDGSRVTKGGDLGDISLRFSVTYQDFGGAIECRSKPQRYEIHGDRCKNLLAKLVGDGPGGKCAADKSKLDLGSFIESSDKGCLLWNVWAVKTH